MRTKNPIRLQEIVEYIDKHYEDYRKSPTIDEIASKLKMARTTVQRYLVELDNIGEIKYNGKSGIETERIAKMRGGSFNVALVGEIACGSPAFAEENITEYFSLPEALIGRGNFFLLKAKGDSMINVGIDSGDLVLIRKQEYANPHDIVVALCEDSETTLKTYIPNGDTIILRPENDDMEDIIVEHCDIQGVAVKVLKDL